MTDYKGFRITSLWAFTQVGEDDEEGIIGTLDVASKTWLPLIASDRVRLNSMASTAQMTANLTGRPVKLSRYSIREDLQTIKPEATP